MKFIKSKELDFALCYESNGVVVYENECDFYYKGPFEQICIRVKMEDLKKLMAYLAEKEDGN